MLSSQCKCCHHLISDTNLCSWLPAVVLVLLVGDLRFLWSLTPPCTSKRDKIIWLYVYSFEFQNCNIIFAFNSCSLILITGLYVINSNSVLGSCDTLLRLTIFVTSTLFVMICSSHVHFFLLSHWYWSEISQALLLTVYSISTVVKCGQQ